MALDFRVTSLEENGGGNGNSSVAELEVRVETLEGTAVDHETRLTTVTKMVTLTVHVNKPYQLFYSCISKVPVVRIQTGTCNNDAAKISNCSMLL